MQPLDIKPVKETVQTGSCAPDMNEPFNTSCYTVHVLFASLGHFACVFVVTLCVVECQFTTCIYICNACQILSLMSHFADTFSFLCLLVCDLLLEQFLCISDVFGRLVSCLFVLGT